MDNKNFDAWLDELAADGGITVRMLIESSPPLVAARCGWEEVLAQQPAAAPVAQGLTDAKRVADVLLAAWQKAEPTHSVSQYPESYKATFLDMARAILAQSAPRADHSRERAAPSASAQQAEPVDGCTEENCRRCRTPEGLRTPDMYHAGLSAAAEIADEVCANSRNHLFRSGAKVVAGAIRSAAPAPSASPADQGEDARDA